MVKPSRSPTPQPPSANPNKSFEVLPAPSESVSSLSFSPTTNHLVATAWDNQVRCWEVLNGSCIPKAAISHDAPVLCSAWTGDGTTVFSGGCDKQVKMWPLTSGVQPITVAVHDEPVKHVAYISQMNLLVSGSWDKTLRYWDGRQPRPVHIQQLPDKCYALAVDYPLMVVGSGNENLIVFDLQFPQTEYKRMQSPINYQTRCLATFPDKQGFLVGSIHGRVGIEHLDDSQKDKNFTFRCHRNKNGDLAHSVNSLNFHPVHHTFATTGSDGTFSFWDKENKHRVKGFSQCPAPIPCSAFNADGSLFAYAVCYDWSKGAENHDPSNATSHIYLHSVQEHDAKPKYKKK
ncbi:mRNA export factor [Rhynchospora pubera]|uniref:mRNA export factor n=1 Tax=Rhynchospora pubera TaxID=906938 RepID=A0AAV8H9I6_9POAL|nr:mRNA export factor [Rhynchospora pubera]